MKKNIIIGLLFVVCLCLVGYTGYYIGTKTAQTTIVEEVQDTNIEELTNSIKAEVYNNAYEDGYNQGKIEVFQMMLEEEQQQNEDTETIQEVEETTSTTSDTPSSSTQNDTQYSSYSCQMTCEYCGETFTNSDDYLYHYQECSSKNATYSIPDQQTATYNNNSNSELRFYGEQFCICPFCGQEIEQSKFTEHYQTHQDSEDYDW